MALDVDKILEIATALKKAHDQVRILELQLIEATKGQLGALAAAGVLSSLGNLGPPSGSMGDRIENLINQYPDKLFTFREVFEGIDAKADNDPYIRSLLSRMVKEGRIASRGWGKYGAVPQK